MGFTRERIRQIETVAKRELRILAETYPLSHFKQDPAFPTMDHTENRTSLSPLDTDQFDLTRMLDTLSMKSVAAAIATCEAEFKEAKTRFDNRMKSLSILKKAVEARDGHRSQVGLPSNGLANVGQHRRGGRKSNRDRIVAYLSEHGPAENGRIISDTAINGSSVSATLVTHPDLFVKREDKWTLTIQGKTHAASLQASAG